METKRGSVTSVGNLRQSMDEIASSVEGDVPVIISIVVKLSLIHISEPTRPY